MGLLTAIVTILFTLFVVGLALLAQWARKNRSAEITLWIVLLAVSLMVVVIGATAGLGLVARAAGETISASERLAFVVGGAIAAAAGLVGLGLCVPPLMKIMGRPPRHAFWADPPIFLALWLFVLVLANNAVSFLVFTQSSNVSSLFSSGRLSVASVATSQLPFVAVGLAGVGLGVRRNFRQSLSRLGYGRIKAKHLIAIVLFIAVAFAVSASANVLFQNLQPDLARRVGTLSNNLFSPKGLSPVSAVFFALLIGFGAALGEETIFRGALQPVLGIVPTSILFASMHIQYGPSVLLVFIFLLAVGLGLLRKYVNTTASFLAHACYNSLGILLAYFVGGGF